MEYLTGGSETRDASGCIFCDAAARADDEEARVLHRGGDVFVLLNAFPYNTGHLMIAPLRHVGELEGMGSGGRTELMETTFHAVEILREAMGPDGFNVGLNLGAAAGAGVPGHLHMHVVPRWSGDTNFMPVVGNTKVLPEMLAETYRKLRPLFADL